MKTLGRILRWTLVAAVAMVLGLVGLERIAAERVEVVELVALNAEGELQTTRLWIADDEGMAYLRVGADGSGWYDRIRLNETVTVIRGARAENFRVVPRPEKSARINELMRRKYTWGDAFIAALVGSREGSLPLELVPADPED